MMDNDFGKRYFDHLDRVRIKKQELNASLRELIDFVEDEASVEFTEGTLTVKVFEKEYVYRDDFPEVGIRIFIDLT